MKNITLSADEQLIESARDVARSRHVTLNQLFRDWLEQLVRGPSVGTRYDQLMEQLGSVECDRPFSRDELNER